MYEFDADFATLCVKSTKKMFGEPASNQMAISCFFTFQPSFRCFEIGYTDILEFMNKIWIVLKWQYHSAGLSVHFPVLTSFLLFFFLGGGFFSSKHY